MWRLASTGLAFWRYWGSMPSYYGDPAAPAANVPRRIGAAAVMERDGAFLVERRRDDGSWGFVGGALDDEEIVLEAPVQRSIRDALLAGPGEIVVA